MAETDLGVFYPDPGFAFPPGFTGEDGAFQRLAESVEEAFAIKGSITVGVPSDYATMQAAVNDLSRKWSAQGTTITIHIEAGHKPAVGLTVRHGDYSRFRIVGADATPPAVHEVDDSFTGDLFQAENAVLPVIASQFTMLDNGRYGVFLFRGSRALILPDAGVNRAGERGLYLNQGCSISAFGAAFRRAGDRNVYIARDSRAMLESANLSSTGGPGTAILNCCISRGSWAHLDNADLRGSPGIGLCVRRSFVSARSIDCSNAGGDGLQATQGSHVTVNRHSATDPVSKFNNCDRGIVASEATIVDARNAEAKNNTAGQDLVIFQGSQINATAVDTTSGAPSAADTNVAAFNAIDGPRGIIWSA